MNSSTQIVSDKRLELAAVEQSLGGPLWGYLALSLPAMFLTLDMAVALARGWRIHSRLDTAVALGSLIWLATATALVALPAGRRFYNRWRGQLILLCASACMGWLVAELALGPVLAAVAEPFHCRGPGLDFIYRPRPGIMRDVGSEAHVHFNAWGVRGDEPPGRLDAYRILCIGGSSTACTYLDNSKTWAHLLGQDLVASGAVKACWVGNVGMPSFRTAQHLQFIEESPLIDQMDCLVVQAGLNDFMSFLDGPQPVPLWTYSRVRKLARSLGYRFTVPSIQVEDTAGQVYVRRRAMRAAAEINHEALDLQHGLDEYAENVSRIFDACARRHVRVVFTTQPALWRPDLDTENESLLWFGQLPDGNYLAVDRLREGLDRYNETLRRVCRERDAELVELSRLDGDPAMFYDDCHFTQTGARRVADLVAEHFAARPIERMAAP